MDDDDELLRPLVDSWLGVVEECARAKQDYNDVARMCRSFYSGRTGFMWTSDFKSKYFRGLQRNPKFAVTLNKAFELVAIYGPYLYWKYPHRRVENYERTPAYPDVLGDPQDPAVQQMWSMLEFQMGAEDRVNEMRNGVMQQYLNYAQREQPGGGLARHSKLALGEALTVGRGCLWTDTYRFPGSNITLTRSNFDTVDNLYVDPDCTDPTLQEAEFIIRKHVNTSWQLERMFKLPKGSLLGKGSMESGKSQGGYVDGDAKGQRKQKKIFDLICWYEIFSKCGVGTRIKGAPKDMEKRFDEVVGDHAYLCVARGIKYPLNLPPDSLKKMYDDEVREALDWPCPFWKDNRWPVQTLDFYHDHQTAWPIPPLAPGLGELICINVLASAAVTTAFDNSQQIIGVLQATMADVEAAFSKRESPTFIPLREGMAKSVADCISYVQRQEINKDVWNVIEYLSATFDKRVGLPESLYAMTPETQARSAEESRIRQSNASARAEYMAQETAKWQTSVAECEKMCAMWHVKSKDVAPTLGPIGALVWEKYIENEDPEVIVREMRCYVDAGDMKKPNKEREAANLQEMMQYLVPVLNDHATATGDTEPLNGLIEMTGEAIEQDTSRFRMGPRIPMPPDPQMMELEQQKMQLEMLKLQTDAEKSQVEAQAKQQEGVLKQQEFAMDAEAQERELQLKAVEGEQDMQLEQQKTQQQILLEAMKARSQMQIEGAKAKSQIELQQAQGAQQMQQQAEQHQQEQKMGAMKFTNDLTQSRMDHAQKMSQARQQAKAKPKPSRNGKA